jgi:hypothetical protein
MATTREIRRAALFSALIIGAGGTVYRLAIGEGPARALFLGTAAVVVSLVVWAVYHLTGRRNDGLVMVWLMASQIASNPAPAGRAWVLPLVSLVVGCTLARLFGLAARLRSDAASVGRVP